MQEELDLKPGHRVLDVGSGCGIITACAAFLVRPPACLHNRLLPSFIFYPDLLPMFHGTKLNHREHLSFPRAETEH